MNGPTIPEKLTGPVRSRLGVRECVECGRHFQPIRIDQEYCATSCRKAHDNRRMTRGAEAYDLLMIMRHERPVAKLRGVWSLLCALARIWKEEDQRERAGRRSWRKPEHALRASAYGRAKVVNHNAAGNKRR